MPLRDLHESQLLWDIPRYPDTPQYRYRTLRRTESTCAVQAKINSSLQKGPEPWLNPHPLSNAWMRILGEHCLRLRAKMPLHNSLQIVPISIYISLSRYDGAHTNQPIWLTVHVFRIPSHVHSDRGFLFMSESLKHLRAKCIVTSRTIANR